jgi:hypothetical protein
VTAFTQNTLLLPLEKLYDPPAPQYTRPFQYAGELSVSEEPPNDLDHAFVLLLIHTACSAPADVLVV